jgi:hypothetical protein
MEAPRQGLSGHAPVLHHLGYLDAHLLDLGVAAPQVLLVGVDEF